MTEHFGYNARGLKSTHTDFNGETTYYDYDAHNRLYRVDAPDGESITYAYYPDGKRQTVTDSRGDTGYTYDVRGRLDTVTNPDGSFLSYTYDAVGNRLSVTIPSGTTSYTYDDLNRLETVTAPDLGITSYTYTLQGKPDLVSYPNGTVADHDYDDLGRLTYLENRKADSSIISSYDYTLDAAGNRTQVTEADGRVVDYTYDALHRLTQESITEADPSTRTHDYTYDWVGNRESKTTCIDGTCELVSYEYNGNNQLVSETGVSGTTSYFYDSNGNTIEKTDGVDVTTYAWDWANRLVSADTPSDSLSFEYDAEGARAGKTVNGVSVGFLVDKNRPYAQVLEERDGVGGLVASYVYGADLVSMDRGGVESWYHYDGLGSTRALSDASATISDEYSYTAYGVPLDSTGTTINAYAFAGEQTDVETGLQFLRARYMDPALGRFLGMDPCVSCNDRVPITGNEYLYGNANPVMGIDPSGEFTLIELSVAGAISSIIASVQASAASARYQQFCSKTGMCSLEHYGLSLDTTSELASNYVSLFTLFYEVAGNFRAMNHNFECEHVDGYKCYLRDFDGALFSYGEIGSERQWSIGHRIMGCRLREVGITGLTVKTLNTLWETYEFFRGDAETFSSNAHYMDDTENDIDAVFEGYAEGGPGCYSKFIPSKCNGWWQL